MSYPPESEQITRSVGAVGVLQPIIVSGCPCEGGYQIITGFRRAYACRKLGIVQVNAYIYQVNPDAPLAVFYLALRENISHRTFNDVEKSLILHKLLTQFACERHDVINEYMPILRLAPNAKVLETYLHIMTFEEEIRAYIATHELPMSMIDLLAGLSSENRHAVFTLLSNLKLGVNKTKELLTYLDEIALRDQCSISRIVEEECIQEILRHEKYSDPQKTNRIRRVLKEKRYPELTRLEQEYQQRIKQLRVPSGVQIQTNRFFEDDDLSVTFRIHSPEQLHTIAEELQELSRKPEFSKLLDLIQGINGFSG